MIEDDGGFLRRETKPDRALPSDGEHQCEVCDEFFDGEPIMSDETGRRQFCSDDCLQEALDDLRIAEIERKQQWELYGDDLDSWFR